MRNPRDAELNALARISLFCGLEREELNVLATTMDRRSFGRGEVIYHKDDAPTGLYILLSGEAKTRILLADDRQITFHIFRTGGYFGMHSLLVEQGRSSDAVAVTRCETLFFPRDRFLDFLESHPEATRELLRVMAGMYQTAARRLQDLALLDVKSRVAKELVQLASRRRVQEHQGEVCLNISQSELACLVGATRESTNKWLRFFEHEGWILLRRGNITVIQVDKLEERVEAG